MSAAVVVERLVKRYGRTDVVHGIDFEVATGQVFGLLGPNGAGKTTTVEILEGYRHRSAGEVRVLGLDPGGQPVALRRRVGIVLQQCALPGELRVHELLDAYRDYYPRPRPTDELLELVELRSERDAPIKSLSGGQQRRLDLALALTGDPELVFLDEPTTGFDPAARRRCWEAVKNLASLGKTVMLTTHYLDEAESLADRVAVIVGGRIVAEGSPADLAGRQLAPSRVRFRMPEGHSVDELPAVLGEVTVDQGRASLAAADPDAALYALLSWARDCQVSLADLTVTAPTLEEIFLTLAGAS